MLGLDSGLGQEIFLFQMYSTVDEKNNALSHINIQEKGMEWEEPSITSEGYQAASPQRL